MNLQSIRWTVCTLFSRASNTWAVNVPEAREGRNRGGFRTDTFVQKSGLIFSHTPAERLSCPAVSMLEISLMCALWARRWRINRSLFSRWLFNDLQLCFVSNLSLYIPPFVRVTGVSCHTLKLCITRLHLWSSQTKSKDYLLPPNYNVITLKL